MDQKDSKLTYLYARVMEDTDDKKALQMLSEEISSRLKVDNLF